MESGEEVAKENNLIGRKKVEETTKGKIETRRERKAVIIATRASLSFRLWLKLTRYAPKRKSSSSLVNMKRSRRKNVTRDVLDFSISEPVRFTERRRERSVDWLKKGEETTMQEIKRCRTKNR